MFDLKENVINGGYRCMLRILCYGNDDDTYSESIHYVPDSKSSSCPSASCLRCLQSLACSLQCKMISQSLRCTHYNLHSN